jgi:hypothetical protein
VSRIEIDEGVFRYTGRALRVGVEEMIDWERQHSGGLGAFERDWLVARAPDSVRRNLRRASRHPLLVGLNGPVTGPEGQPVANPSSYTSVNTTNVETNLWTQTIWTPIPATMRAGAVYQGNAGGVLGTSSAAPTATWTPRVGISATPSSNVTMGATTAATMIASLAAVPWGWTFTFTIRALGLAASGASGTGNGMIWIGGLTTAVGVVQSMGGTVASTIDNTITNALILSNTWGTNAAANTVTAQWTAPVVSLN